MPDFLNALRTFRTIRGKLGAAIALIIGLALCIGLVAVMSFTHFGKIFDAIISGALPEIQVANEIAVMAKDVAAAAPALGLSPDLPHLDLKRRRILDQMEKIKASAASFKGDFLENAGPKIHLSIHALEGHLEALFLNRKRELILHLEIDGLLLEVETVSGELNEILQPVRDKTLIKLILTLIELSGAEGEGADEMM
ncbi:MAG: hypothetical protein GY859_06585, partial [Desulfobacterales bacterium]|nr:hypothetical protein [Desulfobacterales bacterium]